jgi:hypothetical protein
MRRSQFAWQEYPLIIICALKTTSSLMVFIAWVYTVHMRFIPPLTAVLALAFLSLVSSSLAAKIEGVYVGTLGQASVVFKLEKPGDTDLSGAYYYRNYARDIQLNGVLSGSGLLLEERGLYGGNAKAKLSLKLGPNGFSGTWTDVKSAKSSAKSLPVKLHAVTPAELNAVKLPNTPLLRKWKLEEAYEYLRFDAPLKAMKLEKFNGKNVQWWLEPRSKISFFRLSEKNMVNNALIDEQYAMASSALQCPNDSEDGFTFDPKIVLYSKRLLSMTGPVYYDCGGVHPDGYSENLTLDLQSGKVLKLEDLYRFAAVPKGLDLQTQEPFELFSGFTQARAVVLKKLILQEFKTFSTDLETDCKELYETGDVFQFITWFLTPEGLKIQPSFPHVAAACAKDFLLPYAKLKPYLAANSPLK